MQLEELQTEHQRRQQRLQEAHCCTMQDLEHARQRDLKVGGGEHYTKYIDKQYSLIVDKNKHTHASFRG